MTTIISAQNPYALGNALQIVSTPANVVGTDGAIPSYNPSAAPKIWFDHEIFSGAAATGKHIPKIGDMILVLTADTVTFAKVIGYQNNMTSVAQELNVARDQTAFSPADVFTGVGFGAPSDTFRVYVDTSVTPNRLNIDGMLSIAGTEPRSFKLFKGSTAGAGGTVVSMRYNNQGTFVGDSIALKPLQQTQSATTLWGFPEFHTNQVLQSGEVVTLVIYTDTGAVYHHRQLMVQNTDYFRTVDYTKKTIDRIELQSPFLDSLNGYINYPINTLVGSVSMQCVVHYTNGTNQVVVIDGSRARLNGFSQYQATYTGQNFEVALQYTLAADEQYFGAGLNVDGSVITRLYSARTSSSPGNFNYRLYCVPQWNTAASRFDLRWWLMNLDRTIAYEATTVVTVNQNGTPYDPTLFNSQQTLSVSVDVQDVHSSMPDYKYTQNLKITLFGSPATRDTPFAVSYDINQTLMYGDRTYATAATNAQGNTNITLSPGFSAQSDWLDRLYGRTKPSFDPAVETAPVLPSHFIIVTGTNVASGAVEVDMNNWNSVAVLPGSAANWQGKTLPVVFINKLTAGVTKYLATGSVYVR